MMNRSSWAGHRSRRLTAALIGRKTGEDMAIGAYFHPGSMTAEQYDKVFAELEDVGAGRPAGLVSHCVFGPPDNLMIFDIWENQQVFDEFGKVLAPIMEKNGISGESMKVLPIHHMIF
jgi:hypothetical protein